MKARLARGAPNQEKVQKVMSLVRGTLDYADFSDVDMVIEVLYLHKSSPFCPNNICLFLFGDLIGRTKKAY